MPVGPEIRFKVTPDEYRYLEGLAKFFFDNRVIQKRERRQKVIRSIIGDENNKSGSSSP